MGSFGTSKSKNESQSKSFIQPQEDVLTQFLESQRSRIGQGQPIFGGDRVAGFSDLQNRALAAAPQTFFRTPEQEADIFAGSIEKPALRRFQQETVPLIREEFAGPGFFGSARAQETVRAGEDLGSRLETARSDLRRETGDINRAGVRSLFDFGAAQQAQQQRVINDQVQRFVEETRLTNPEDVAILTALLGLNFSTSSGEGSGSGFNFGVLAPKPAPAPTG